MDKTFLSLEEIKNITGFPKSLIHALIQENLFPLPAKIEDGQALWRDTDITPEYVEKTINAFFNKDEKKPKAQNEDECVSYKDIQPFLRDDYGCPDIQELLIELILKTTDINKSGVKGRRDMAFKAVLGDPDKERRRTLKKLEKRDKTYKLKRKIRETESNLWEEAKKCLNDIEEDPNLRNDQITSAYKTLKNQVNDFAENEKEYAKTRGENYTEPYERFRHAKKLISIWISRWSY